ncbi:hypothetical protein SAMD00023353_1002060 [Rosellinia necatrix]|uniref:Uncharacterized protein n=1 Tax=Rosellinia necatrix TaxID=77044 RepID=A0A1S8A6C0_ROSNE|nr:hypothetical protein SAMD00023353_1002060 [Rosellinia necatrix]
MGDSREGVRFMGYCGQEHARFKPIVITHSPGGMTETEKYLCGANVTWIPRGADKSRLMRFNAPNGLVEGDLEKFLYRNLLTSRRQAISPW